MSITREEAWNLLTEFNKEEFHLQHAQIVEKTMEYLSTTSILLDESKDS